MKKLRRYIILSIYLFSDIVFNELPLRVLFLRFVFMHLPFISYQYRLRFKAVPRSHYGFCIYNAICLAEKLGYKKISIIEFGVAAGKGLKNIEYHVQQISKTHKVKVEIYGFDLAKGLPKPKDYRDLPYQWSEGLFKMDIDTLQQELGSAKLLLGDVKETVEKFLQTDYAPIGCVLFDLDYYSSTIPALKIFEANFKRYLPRVFCYFDDLYGNEYTLYNRFSGELLAIEEFNQLHSTKKIAPLRSKEAPWEESIYIFHDFKHPKYNEFMNTDYILRLRDIFH